MKQEHLQVRCQGNLLYLNKIQSCLFFCLNKRIEQNDSLRTHLTKKILFIPFNKVQCQDLYLERIFKCNLRISVIWKEIIYKYICMYKYMNKETVNCHVFHRSLIDHTQLFASGTLSFHDLGIYLWSSLSILCIIHTQFLV